MRDKWAFKYINFNNVNKKKAKEQQIRKVKRELKAKKARDPPPPPQVTVPREKDQLIRALQVRWWYILPDWPVLGADFTPQLTEKGLKVVPDRDLGSEIKEESVKDKVRPIGGFPGLFQNVRGRIYDVRDKATCPSYYNLAEKSEAELEELLLGALRNQLSVLKAQTDYDAALAEKLEERITTILTKPPKPVNEPVEESNKNEPVEDFIKTEEEDIYLREVPRDIREAMEEEEWP